MTTFKRLSCIALGLICGFVAVTVINAEETGKYGQWQSADERLEKMINELDRLIKEGVSSRAAHPEFLKDLQRTVDNYRTPQKTIFFSDDFTDSDFTQNPAWTARSGEFTVDRYGSLYSSIAIRRPAPQDENAASGGDRNLRILLGVLNELSKDGKEEPGPGEIPEQALIFSTAAIPNSFNMRFSFRSAANWGSTSIGVFQGEDPKSGYHLVYQASPLDGRPMQLIKYRYGKPYIIEEVAENSPNLDDGLDHILQLNRAANGDITVTVDNNEILRTSDLSFKDDFTGIVIMNNGGSYSYDNIEIYTER